MPVSVVDPSKVNVAPDPTVIFSQSVYFVESHWEELALNTMLSFSGVVPVFVPPLNTTLLFRVPPLMVRVSSPPPSEILAAITAPE